MRGSDVPRAVELGLTPSKWAEIQRIFGSLDLFRFGLFVELGMTADEVVRWGQTVCDPNAIRAYRELGVDLDRASGLAADGLDGSKAREAAAQGVDLETAASWVAVGLQVSDVRRAEALGLSPSSWANLQEVFGQLDLLRYELMAQVGLRTDDIVSLGRAGCDPDAIRAFTDLGLDLDRAQALGAAGLSGSDAKEAAGLALDLEIAAAWSGVGFPMRLVSEAESRGATPMDWLAAKELPSGLAPGEVAAEMVAAGLSVDNLTRWTTLGVSADLTAAILRAGASFEELHRWVRDNLCVLAIDPDSAEPVSSTDLGALPDPLQRLVGEMSQPEEVAAVLEAFGCTVLWRGDRSRIDRAQMGRGTDHQGQLLSIQRSFPGGATDGVELHRVDGHLIVRREGQDDRRLGAICVCDALAGEPELREIRPDEIIEIQVADEEFPDVTAFTELLELIARQTKEHQSDPNWTGDQYEIIEPDIRTHDGLALAPLFINGQRWAILDETYLVPLDAEAFENEEALSHFKEIWGDVSISYSESMVPGSTESRIGLITPTVVCEAYSDDGYWTVRGHEYLPYQKAADLCTWVNGLGSGKHYLSLLFEAEVRAMMNGQRKSAPRPKTILGLCGPTWTQVRSGIASYRCVAGEISGARLESPGLRGHGARAGLDSELGSHRG